MAMGGYCGQPAGFLRRQHAGCAAKHRGGVLKAEGLAQQAASRMMPLDQLGARIKDIAVANFLTKDEVYRTDIEGWEKTDCIIVTNGRPIDSATLVDQINFVEAVGERDVDRLLLDQGQSRAKR